MWCRKPVVGGRRESGFRRRSFQSRTVSRTNSNGRLMTTRVNHDGAGTDTGRSPAPRRATLPSTPRCSRPSSAGPTFPRPVAHPVRRRQKITVHEAGLAPIRMSKGDDVTTTTHLLGSRPLGGTQNGTTALESSRFPSVRRSTRPRSPSNSVYLTLYSPLVRGKEKRVRWLRFVS